MLEKEEDAQLAQKTCRLTLPPPLAALLPSTAAAPPPPGAPPAPAPTAAVHGMLALPTQKSPAVAAGPRRTCSRRPQHLPTLPAPECRSAGPARARARPMTGTPTTATPTTPTTPTTLAWAPMATPAWAAVSPPTATSTSCRAARTSPSAATRSASLTCPCVHSTTASRLCARAADARPHLTGAPCACPRSRGAPSGPCASRASPGTTRRWA